MASRKHTRTAGSDSPEGPGVGEVAGRSGAEAAASLSSATGGRSGFGSGEYLVLARRFRPRSFSEVVGQKAAILTLQNAIRSGRVHHAYLFTGPRGVGKTSLARILAKALNCVEGPAPDPCNRCERCRSVDDGSDLDVIEIDGASHRLVEDAEKLREEIRYAPNRSRYKIYIIDEVHMLSTHAFNALLKTLEEPPPHVKFIFATTDVQKLPETIISRCHRFDFRRLGPAEIVERLKQICAAEGAAAEEAALAAIARLSRGGMRDAEGLLDQAIVLSGGSVTVEAVRQVTGAIDDGILLDICEAAAGGNSARALDLVCDCLEAGAQPGEILDQLLGALRGLAIRAFCGPSSVAMAEYSHMLDRISGLYAKASPEKWLFAIDVLAAARQAMRDSGMARLALETAVLKICRLDDIVDISRALNGLRQAFRQAPAAGPASGLAAVGAAVPSGAGGGGEIGFGVAFGRTAAAEEDPRRPESPADGKPAVRPPSPAAAQSQPAVQSRTGKSGQAAGATGSAHGLYKGISVRSGMDPDIERIWPRFVERFRGIARIALSHITGARISGDTLVLSFSSPQYAAAVSSPAEMDAMEAAAAELLGRPVRISAVPFDRATNKAEGTVEADARGTAVRMEVGAEASAVTGRSDKTTAGSGAETVSASAPGRANGGATGPSRAAGTPVPGESGGTATADPTCDQAVRRILEKFGAEVMEVNIVGKRKKAPEKTNETDGDD